jgi:ABC-type transport system involved in cytochrome c biogenesis permease subunit
MSRPIVVRRLTAVLALLAVLCLALPAMAAPGAHARSSRAHAVHAPGVLDQILSWIGSFWAGPASGQTDRMDKAGVAVAPSGSVDELAPSAGSEAGGMIDPNG